MLFMTKRSFGLCLLLPLALSVRIKFDAVSVLRESAGQGLYDVDSREAASKLTGTPENMCSDGESSRRACSILRQETNYYSWTAEPWVTTSQLREYFIAEPGDIDSLMKGIYPDLGREEASWVSCKSLCESSLHYLLKAGWTLPVKSGFYCKSMLENSTTCDDWQPIGDQHMTDLAYGMDLTAEIEKRGADDGSVNDGDVRIEVDDGKEAPDGFSYSESELALRIANLFNIFPVFPVEEVGYSMLEKPPVFGPYVHKSRYSTWYSTMAEAESWVNTALAKVAGSERAVQTWFGRADATTMRNVRHGLVGMVKTLSMAKIKVGGQPCSPSSSTMAFVTQYSNRRTGEFIEGEKEKDDRGYDRHVINVCDRYWKPEFIDSPASKYGTMVHESSHHQGTTDEEFNGAAPYGRAQCLRMAELAPDKALNNADNFLWFVYYMNHCADAPTSTAITAPCELKLMAAGSSNAKVVTKCTKLVQGATMKLVDSAGRYLQKASNYGTFDEGEWVLTSSLPVRYGNIVKIFYEFDCALWEAEATWRGSGGGGGGVTAKAIKIVDLTDGGTDGNAAIPVLTTTTTTGRGGGGEGGPSIPITAPTRSLCELTIDTDVKLTNGSAGFKIKVRCSRRVTNGVLSFPGTNYRDKGFKGAFDAGDTYSLHTDKISDWVGKHFQFTGMYLGSTVTAFSEKVGGGEAIPVMTTTTTTTVRTKPTNASLPSSAPTRPATLPCELTLDTDVRLTGGGKGFKVLVSCTSKVRDAKLSFHGPSQSSPQYREKMFGDVSSDGKWKLFTHKIDDYEDYTFTFTSTYLGREGSTSVKLDTKQNTPVERRLPCEISIDDDNGWMKLTDGSAGFKVKVRCSRRVTDGVLSFPGTNFRDKSFSTTFGADETYTLHTDSTSEWAGKYFQFTGKYLGSTSTISSDKVARSTRSSSSASKLPCKIVFDDDNGRMRLKSGGRGFDLKLKCDDDVTDVVLRFPNTDFAAKRFSTRIQPGIAYELMTMRRSENIGQKFVIEGECRGKKGSVSATYS